MALDLAEAELARYLAASLAHNADDLELVNLKISERDKLKKFVEYLSKNGKNPSLWYKRTFVCKNW